MFEEEKGRVLGELLELTKDNNRLLRKLVRAHRWAIFGSVLRWLVILAIAFGSYYYLQPYLDKLVDLSSQAAPNLSHLRQLLLSL